MPGQRRADARSLALHRAVAEKLRADRNVRVRAIERVRRWRQSGDVAAYYVDAWEALLERDLDAVATALVEDSEWARSLRQVSPFAGALTARERWRILRDAGG